LVEVGGEQESSFFPGQLFGGDGDLESDEEALIKFVSGQWGVEGDGGALTFLLGQQTHSKGEFLRGQTVKAAGDKPIFLMGEIIVNPKTGMAQFVPGTYDEESGRFVPGMVVDTIDGPMFVEGLLHRMGGGSEAIFVPGKVSVDGTKFAKAEGPSELKIKKIADPASPIDASSLSIVFKKKRPRNGYMIKTKSDFATR
jgi:hypothetical protein